MSLALDERIAFVRGNAAVVMHHIRHQEMVVLRHGLTSAGSEDAYREITGYLRTRYGALSSSAAKDVETV
jgi:hypothetical protein